MALSYLSKAVLGSGVAELWFSSTPQQPESVWVHRARGKGGEGTAVCV